MQLRSNLVLLFLALSGCSPFFVMRAGYEEVSILARRESIAKLLQSPTIDDSLKDKFLLVQQAREFSQSIGLEPKGSFAEYSKIDRDVLVWVLSAAPKDSFDPYTWWFPFVGHVPYRGYFSQAEGESAARTLAKNNFDTFLRPSPAYSTLGWFDDPLLSTYIHFSDIDLANTVIHEITHNTVWFPDYVEFNETLAHVIGSIGAAEFFRRARNDSSAATQLESQFADDLAFADFLKDTRDRLELFYTNIDKSRAGEKNGEFLKQRQEIFDQANTQWDSLKSTLRSTRYQGPLPLNNASLVAWQIYLMKPQVILKLYEACEKSLERFICEIKDINRGMAKRHGLMHHGADPYQEVILRTEQLNKMRSS